MGEPLLFLLVAGAGLAVGRARGGLAQHAARRAREKNAAHAALARHPAAVPNTERPRAERARARVDRIIRCDCVEDCPVL
jgi:hypothetical protein